MFQLILTRKRANVFFEDANEHNSKIQFFNQLDKWNKFHIVMKWNRMSNMCNKKETILMKQIYKYIFIYKSIWRCNIYIWHIHCIWMSYEKRFLSWFCFCHIGHFHIFELQLLWWTKVHVHTRIKNNFIFRVNFSKFKQIYIKT